MQELTNFGVRPGLERMEYLLHKLGNPQQDYPYVHIAGTNGKGTVTQLISHALCKAGYRTGKFTSPHLHDYTERIQIDGVSIPHEAMLVLLDRIEACVPDMMAAGFTHPTEFEVLTAAGFLYFRDEQVDIAVLEAGLGGTLDATNVIIPEVSVITGIDYDHTGILGTTLTEIAENKAGIIKQGVPVVIGEMPQEAERVIVQTAQAKQSSVIRSSDCRVLCEKVEETGQQIRITGVFPALYGEGLMFNLLGSYQRRNLAVALMALEVLRNKGYALSAETIRATLSEVRMPGRLEVVSNHPLVLVDVAHNPQGAKALGESLKEIFPEKQKVLVCAILDDKDAESMMASLAFHTRKVIFTQPLGARGVNWKRLLTLWQELFPEIPAAEEADIVQAVQKALHELQADEYLMITGSFYLMDPARKIFVAE